MIAFVRPLFGNVGLNIHLKVLARINCMVFYSKSDGPGHYGDRGC
ncbi:MAG: hypothetical protein ACI82I_001034 [Gammaproteobacteria bacterium]|jgi:hypothetical protein